MLQVSFGPYAFAATRSELHDGELGPLRGRTYNLTVCLHVPLGVWRPESQATVHMSVNKLVAPLRDRTLVAEHPIAGRCLTDDRQVTVEAASLRYSLPREHVVLLPVQNTTLELLAAHLLQRLTRELAGIAGLAQIELTLAESPLLAITVTTDAESRAVTKAPSR
jgi:hypothetical protein